MLCRVLFQMTATVWLDAVQVRALLEQLACSVAAALFGLLPMHNHNQLLYVGHCSGVLVTWLFQWFAKCFARGMLICLCWTGLMSLTMILKRKLNQAVHNKVVAKVVHQQVVVQRHARRVGLLTSSRAADSQHNRS